MRKLGKFEGGVVGEVLSIRGGVVGEVLSIRGGVVGEVLSIREGVVGSRGGSRRSFIFDVFKWVKVKLLH